MAKLNGTTSPSHAEGLDGKPAETGDALLNEQLDRITREEINKMAFRWPHCASCNAPVRGICLVDSGTRKRRGISHEYMVFQARCHGWDPRRSYDAVRVEWPTNYKPGEMNLRNLISSLKFFTDPAHPARR